MVKNIIDYGKLVDEAMHIIVCRVLKIIEKEGLPEDHHFFISFVTRHPGVKISKVLIDKYPKEMTIVIQYQYQDLKVDNIGFGITLSFNGHRENIYIPYSAITTFADPSVRFGLHFRETEYDYGELNIEFYDQNQADDMNDDSHPSGDNDGVNGHKKKEDNVVSLDKFRKK